MTIIYQIVNIVLLIILLGVPIGITAILLKRFMKKPISNEDYMLEKIRELENRIKILEDERY